MIVTLPHSETPRPVGRFAPSDFFSEFVSCFRRGVRLADRDPPPAGENNAFRRAPETLCRGLNHVTPLFPRGHVDAWPVVTWPCQGSSENRAAISKTDRARMGHVPGGARLRRFGAGRH